MHVVLIQPPDPAPTVEPMDSSYGSASQITPSIELLNLLSYLRNHTRHSCSFIDTRLLQDPEQHLISSIRNSPSPRIAVLAVTTEGLGAAAGILELLRKHEPALRIVAVGSHPSSHPEFALALSQVHVALCGDPEPLLHHYLEYADIPNRLQKTPGIAMRGGPATTAFWNSDLKGISLPDFQGVPWAGYSVPAPRKGSIASIRLSRGHTKEPADRAMGLGGEPLRIWPFDRVAAALHKCAALGIVDVFLGDPIGFWNEARIQDWCAAMNLANNTQPWSFQMMPMALNRDTLVVLHESWCRRIEVVFPSCSPEVLERFGVQFDDDALSETIFRLQDLEIEVEARIWVGGPEEGKGEAERIVRTLSLLGFMPYSLHAFPYRFDAPMQKEVSSMVARPSLAEWIAWSGNPWSEKKPVLLWGGADAAARIEETMQAAERAVQRHPKRRILRIAQALQSLNPIRSLETRALGFLNHRRSHS